MATKGIKTQGTELYWIHLTGGTYSVKKIYGMTAIGDSPGTAPEIDMTDLDSTAKERLYGLPDNGSLSISLNILKKGDTGLADQRLFTRQGNGDEYTYVIGDADGTAPVTVHASTGVITYPTTRSYTTFTGVFGGTSIPRNANDAKRGTVTLGVSGAMTFNDIA